MLKLNSLRSQTILIMLLLGSCQQTFRKSACISGNFSDATGIKLVLQEMETKEIRIIDSVTLDNSGSFRFDPVISEPGF